MLHDSLGTMSLRQDKNKGTNNLIAKLISDELNKILETFSKETSGKKVSRAKQVQQISKVQLLRMCTQLKLEPPTRSARKIQLQTLVFGKILRKSLSNDQEVGTETDPVAETDQQPKEITQANPKKEKKMLAQRSLAELYCKHSRANPLHGTLSLALVSEKRSLIILSFHFCCLTEPHTHF